MYDEIQKQLESLEKYVKPLIKDLKQKNKFIKKCSKHDSETIKELKKENERLKNKYYKFWNDNKKLRQKVKPYYKYLSRINMNKISGEDAIRELKEARRVLAVVAYSYQMGDNYGNE